MLGRLLLAAFLGLSAAAPVAQPRKERRCTRAEVQNGTASSDVTFEWNNQKVTIPVQEFDLLDCTHLVLEKQNLGDAGASSLAEALKTPNHLEAVVLAQNNIGDTGAMALAEAMSNANCKLIRLHLQKNNVGDEGATAIADSMKKHAHLKTLNLASNQIGDAGAAAVADGVRSHKSLKVVDLSDNGIHDKGALAMANALRKDSGALETLDLYGNPFGDAAASALTDLFKTNDKFTTLNLAHRSLGAKMMHKIAASNEHTTEVLHGRRKILPAHPIVP